MAEQYRDYKGFGNIVSSTVLLDLVVLDFRQNSKNVIFDEIRQFREPDFSQTCGMQRYALKARCEVGHNIAKSCISAHCIVLCRKS